ncbi:hypothetical protein E4U43_004183 [Claviceps pusilla]|uniref:CSC1/OSCA1-like N-terminal transmembrane domain-containing protein n=1 Tax=Claviceps pusilla TaxID=123648 RepID=A0A9P7SWA6_9HYPO|nr:hypothetical protein E4U43_004183 [Claviceps pusilla]
MAFDAILHPKSTSASELWRFLATRGLDLNVGGDQDLRQGSARNGSAGGTISTKTNNKGSSAQKLGTTFIPVVVFVCVCLIAFIVLRRFCKRVYAPRTIPELRVPK